VLADTLRTDRARLRPLIPDSQATTTLRDSCRARKDLIGHRVAAANQLRAHLNRVLPGVVGLFDDLDSPISLRFLTRFDTQDRVDWLSKRRLAAWLSSVSYSGKVDPTVLYGRLSAAPRGLTGPDATTTAPITHALVTVLASLVEQIKGAVGTHRPTTRPDTPTPTSSPPCPAPAGSAPPDCWPRSATAEPSSPPPSR
jgi:transposase